MATIARACTKCGEVKSLDRFPKNPRYRDGHSTWCRDCHNAYQRQWVRAHREIINVGARRWRAANPEAVRESRRRYEEAHKETARATRERYREAHREEARQKTRQWYREQARWVRVAALTFYSETEPASCTCCAAIGNLSIDHIHGDGAEHRKQLGNSGGYVFHRWLIRNNFPPGFQTLCRACNNSKGTTSQCNLHHSNA